MEKGREGGGVSEGGRQREREREGVERERERRKRERAEEEGGGRGRGMRERERRDDCLFKRAGTCDERGCVSLWICCECVANVLLMCC